MSTSPNLNLPFLQAAQAQKHVTVNEALKALDVLVQLAVLDRDLAAPPVSPVDGDRYIVAAGPTGAWVGHAKSIAAWLDGAWTFFAPPEGWLAWVRDENILATYDGSAWASYSATITELQNLARLGIGTTADATNPLSAKINKALFTAKTVAEGGDGDLRYTLNKESASDVLSLLFQSGFSGRAEMGLIGDDNFLIKVSPDGSAFNNAILIDKTTGAVSFPSTTITPADDSVTDAKLRNSAALSVIGRGANSTGDPADIAAASDGDVLRRSGTTLGFGAVATAGITDDAITNAKLANMATATIKGRTTAGSGDPEDLSAVQTTAILNAMVGDSGAGGTKGLVPAPAAGDAAANKVLGAGGAWQAGNLRLLDATAFTANGTWTKPAGAKLVYVACCGGGAGGASGAAGDLTVNRGGAAGSNGGSVSDRWLPADLLGATESVTVGAGVSGAAGVTGASVGNAGVAGNSSSFGAHGFALGGLGGTGGQQNAAAAAGAVRSPANQSFAGWSQYIGGGAGSGTAAGAGNSGTRASIGPGSGGGGGALPTTGVFQNGGNGSAGCFGFSGTSGGSTPGAATDGAAGTAGSSNSGVATDDYGHGGGGGASSATGNGGAGGAGGAPGGAGGGGGAARNTQTSGAGGAGARGEVRVFSYG